MEVSRIENLPPPPGIINSIKAGFDAVAARITAILLPLLLNLFLWLGPRLRMEALFDSIESDLVEVWRQSGQIPAGDIPRMVDLYDQFSRSVNLFSVMRTLPIGISALFSPNQPLLSTPLGTPMELQVSGWNLPVWYLGLTLLGWVGGAIYFHNVAWAVFTEGSKTTSVLRALTQTFLLSIFFNMILTAIVLPAMLVIFVAAQMGEVLVNLVVLFMALASVWVVVPMFFWAHGVFLNQQNVLTSMLSSIRLTRFTLPTSSLFVMMIFLLSYGLNLLWRMPALDSWVTLLAIFGHSFVTTALLAASFIYYRDMSNWVLAVLEKLRPNNLIKQA